MAPSFRSRRQAPEYARETSRLGYVAAVRRSKEIVVLLALLVGAVAFVLWFVAQRRAELRAEPSAHLPRERGPVAPAKQPPPYVDLKAHDAKTIDFSTGQPVVKDSPEDRAALQAGIKDIEEATKDIVFEAQKKPEPKKP